MSKTDKEGKAVKKDAAPKAEKKAAKPSVEKAAAPKKAKAETVEAKAEKAPKKNAAPKAKKEKVEKPKRAKGAVLKDATLYDVIQRPVVTEKSTMASEQNKIVFKVQKTATKERIREAVEQLFGVNVVSINTMVTKGKQKRFRGRPGSRSDVKKAIVTLQAGQTIDLQAGVR